MRTVVKSKLIASSNTAKLNERLQKVIDRYNSEGLIVKIEATYSASANVGGEVSYSSTLYEFILVVGYAKE
jgi:hypothetical protein